MPSNYEFLILPPKRFLHIEWGELWRFRDLFLTLAWRDISVRYKQTFLGVLWAAFQPFIMMVIFSFIFNRMANITSGDGTPYPVFLYVGLLLWQYFSSTVSTASASMVSNASLISKIYFPRLIIPSTSAITGLVDLGIASLILLVMMVYYGFLPSITCLPVIPLLLACIVLSALGTGFFLAAVNIKYRDVRYALPFLIQLLMYVTPVIYPVKMLDSYPIIKRLMICLNPISGVISNARAAILGQGEVDWQIMGISVFVSIVFFVFGLCYFRRSEYYFADVV